MPKLKHPSIVPAHSCRQELHRRIVRRVGLAHHIWLVGVWLVLVTGLSRPVYAASKPPTPMTFVVTNTNDSGPDSLRQAILDANANSGADSIDFDLPGCPCAIELSGGQLEINEDVSINGPGLRDQQFDLILSANSASRLFVINSGAVSISGLVLLNGYVEEPAEFGGGAILNWSSDPLTLTEVFLYGNQAAGSSTVGGAIANFSAPLILNRVAAAYNQAAYGGVVYSETGAVTVTDSFFFINASASGGGAMLIGNVFCGNRQTLCSPEALKDNQRPGEEAVLTNVIFASNYENPGSLGGGALLTAVPATLAHVTFIDNGSYVGVGHTVATYANVTLMNTLIADSSAATDNCYGSVADGGGNLSWPDTGCPGLNSDPLLGTFDYHGGPNQFPTISLLPNSPALDAIPAGTNGCGDVYTTDGRGLPRPQNGACDIGAYEAQMVCDLAPNSSYTVGDVQFHVQTDGVGDIDCIEIKPFVDNHPSATPGLQTGAFWRIDATNSSGDPASGYMLDLTITTSFVPTAQDKLCRYTGATWDCMAHAFDAGLQTITRQNVAQFSDWAAGAGDPLAVTLSQQGQAAQPDVFRPLAAAMMLLGMLSAAFLTRRARQH